MPLPLVKPANIVEEGEKEAEKDGGEGGFAERQSRARREEGRKPSRARRQASPGRLRPPAHDGG